MRNIFFFFYWPRCNGVHRVNHMLMLDLLDRLDTSCPRPRDGFVASWFYTVKYTNIRNTCLVLAHSLSPIWPPWARTCPWSSTHLRGDATSQAVCRSADSDLRLGRLPHKRWGQVVVIKLMIPLKPDQHPGVESLQHHLVVLHVPIDLPCHLLRWLELTCGSPCGDSEALGKEG